MRTIGRKNRFYKSKLDKFTGEIITLYKHGKPVSHIQRWLHHKGHTVAWSTVSRFITNKIGGQ